MSSSNFPIDRVYSTDTRAPGRVCMPFTGMCIGLITSPIIATGFCGCQCVPQPAAPLENAVHRGRRFLRIMLSFLPTHHTPSGEETPAWAYRWGRFPGPYRLGAC